MRRNPQHARQHPVVKACHKRARGIEVRTGKLRSPWVTVTVATAIAALGLALIPGLIEPAGAMVGGQAQSSGNTSYVRILDEGEFDCSGTIVAEQWVLTAAHCFPSGANNPNQVTIQLWQGGIGSSTGWSSGVNQLVLDSRFTQGGFHDLALVHTKSTMPSWAVAIPLVELFDISKSWSRDDRLRLG